MLTTSDLRFCPSGMSLATVLALLGSQTAWAIDPVSGDDNGPGSPSLPLRTMAEFNLRYQDLMVRVPASLQLIGNVLDAPLWLSGTRFGAGASLTVTGTRTDVASATVAVVTGLGPSNTFPWQVQTAGVDWLTVAVGSQVRFSTGQVAMILEVVDADNVIVGAIGAAGVSLTSFAPTVGSIITAATLSRALPPIINASGQAPANTSQINLFDISFDSPSALGGAVNVYSLSGGVLVQFLGCELKFSSSVSFIFSTPCNVRCCRFTQSATLALRSGSDPPQTYGLVVAGTGATIINHNSGKILHAGLSIIGARFFVTGGSCVIGSTHVRKSLGSSCVLVQNDAAVVATGILNGSIGNLGIAIDVPYGRYAYVNAGNKPTITAVTDPRVGGITRTLAQLPFTALQLDAVPPTVTTLVGNGAAIVQEG